MSDILKATNDSTSEFINIFNPECESCQFKLRSASPEVRKNIDCDETVGICGSSLNVCKICFCSDDSRIKCTSCDEKCSITRFVRYFIEMSEEKTVKALLFCCESSYCRFKVPWLCEGVETVVCCSFCHKVSEHSKKCSICVKARYCGYECQKADWKNHKKACKK